jgi:transcriptional regulator with XRE-family HTH domain
MSIKEMAVPVYSKASKGSQARAVVAKSQVGEMQSNNPAPESDTIDQKIARQVGANIKAIREDQGLKQKEIAERIGSSPATVGHDEAGRANMTLSRLQSYADALKVPLPALFVPPHSRHVIGLLSGLMSADPLVRILTLATYQREVVPSEIRAAGQASNQLSEAIRESERLFFTL